MYSPEDLTELNRLMRKFYRNMVLMLIAPALAVAAACIWRIAPLGYAAAVLMGLIICLGWYGVGHRVYAYRGLVKDILTLQERSVEGEVLGVVPNHVNRQGTVFATIRLKVQDGDDGYPYERTVFYDHIKGEPPVEVGQRIYCTLFDNVVKTVTVKDAAPEA